MAAAPRKNILRSIPRAGGRKSDIHSIGEGGPNRDIRPVSMAFARAGAAQVRKPWSGKRKHGVPGCGRDSRRCAMSQLDVVDDKTTADEENASSAYVPPLQRTE